LVRESFREKRLQLSSLDVVVMGRNKLVKMKNTKVRDQLDYLWNKAIKQSAANS